MGAFNTPRDFLLHAKLTLYPSCSLPWTEHPYRRLCPLTHHLIPVSGLASGGPDALRDSRFLLANTYLLNCLCDTPSARRCLGYGRLFERLYGINVEDVEAFREDEASLNLLSEFADCVLRRRGEGWGLRKAVRRWVEAKKMCVHMGVMETKKEEKEEMGILTYGEREKVCMAMKNKVERLVQEANWVSVDEQLLWDSEVKNSMPDCGASTGDARVPRSTGYMGWGDDDEEDDMPDYHSENIARIEGYYNPRCTWRGVLIKY